jgi:hypothetical protein
LLLVLFAVLCLLAVSVTGEERRGGLLRAKVAKFKVAHHRGGSHAFKAKAKTSCRWLRSEIDHEACPLPWRASDCDMCLQAFESCLRAECNDCAWERTRRNCNHIVAQRICEFKDIAETNHCRHCSFCRDFGIPE